MLVMDETTEIRIKNLDTDMAEIKQQLQDLPDQITARLNENIELKISLAKKDLEMKFYKAVAGLTGGLIIEFIVILLQLFLQKGV